MARLQDITPTDFCMAFVAALGTQGRNVFDIRSAQTTTGFAAVLDVLDKQIDNLLKDDNRRAAAIALLKIRSYLAPSVIGSFDRFESCLRGLQTSVIGTFNPEFRDIHSEITEPFASSKLESYAPNVRDIARLAAERFISEVSNT